MQNGQFLQLHALGKVNHQVPEPEPDRTFVDKSKDEPKEKVVVMAAGKKKRKIVDADTRAVAVARVDKLVKAGNPAMKAIATVAKELEISESAVMNWRTAVRKTATQKKPVKKTQKKPAKKTTNKVPSTSNGGGFEALDTVLNFLELASHLRNVLNESSRKRLMAELQTRLS